MPHVQILPAVPSFGNRLAEALGGAASSIGQGYQQGQANKKVAALTEQLNNPTLTPIQKVGITSQIAKLIGPARAKSELPLYAPLIYGKGGQPAPGQQPGTPTQPGVPQGPSAPITAETQPQGLQNAPAPTGQTQSEVEARKAELRALASNPYYGETAKQELEDIRETEKLAAKEKMAIGAEERKASLAEKEKIDTLQSNVIKGYESALVSDANLNRMQALSDSDQIIGPLGAYLTKLFDVPVSLASGPETEEFQKLAAQRGLNVATAYGFGRILQTEFSNFLQTIPSLLNSKEGKDKIIHSLRYFDNLAKARYNVYKNELKGMKKGERAADLELKMTESMAPLYAKFGEVLEYGDELVEMKDKQGNKGKVPKNQINEALSEGYSLVGEK